MRTHYSIQNLVGIRSLITVAFCVHREPGHKGAKTGRQDAETDPRLVLGQTQERSSSAQVEAAPAQVQRRKWTLVGFSIVVRDSSGNTINRSWVLSIDSLCLERQTHFIHYFPALNIRLKKSLFALFYVLGQST